MALLLLTIVPSAAAAPPDPAVEQYVERVPGAGGDQPTQPPGPRGREGASLVPEVKRRIRREGGADAAALDALAGSPALGAPSASGASPARRAPDTRGVPSDPDRPSAVSAGVGAMGHGAGPWIVAAIVLLTVAMAAVAVLRRRPGPR